MKRLEQIKRRFELSLRDPVKYGHLVSNPQADIEYLIGLLERAITALESVSNSGARETMRRYAEEALTQIKGGIKSEI